MFSYHPPCRQWHLGHCNLSLTPMRRGFDSFLGFWGGSEDHFTHFAGGMYDFRDGEEVCSGNVGSTGLANQQNAYSTF